MSWIDNLIKYNRSGQAGKCPKCGDENVTATEHKNGNRLSITFECKKCKAFEHFDGTTTENKQSDGEIVDRIVFSNEVERFSIFMQLGVKKKKRFRSVWQKDTPESEPRLITAHRED